MSSRSIVRLGLIVVVCLAVIVASTLVRARLAAVLGPFRWRELFRQLSAFSLRRFGPDPFFRRPSPLIAGSRGVFAAVAAYACVYLVSLLALFAVPRRLRRLRDAFDAGLGEALRAFGVGVMGALGFVALAVLGFFTLPPVFPLSLLLLLALLLTGALGLIGLALALGQALSRWAGLGQASPGLDLAFGTLVVYTLSRIPLAGPVGLGLLGLLALGTVIATRFGTGGAWSLAEFQLAEESQP